MRHGSYTLGTATARIPIDKVAMAQRITALMRYDLTIFDQVSAVQESLSLSESAKRLQRRRYRKRLLRRTRGNQARERTTRRAHDFR